MKFVDDDDDDDETSLDSTNLHCSEPMQRAHIHRLILHTTQSLALYSSFISAF